MSAPDLSVDSSGHDERREAVAHQQRGIDSVPVSLDGIAPELRSIGGDASGSSRRGSLQPSPAGSPLLQQHGSVSSNTSSGGAYSPMMSSAQIAHNGPPNVNKLPSNGGQHEGHGRPSQYYSSYEQTAFYPPPPPSHHGFARPPPPPAHLPHPSHSNGYAPPPPTHYRHQNGANGNGYPSQPSSLPPLSLPSLNNGASSSSAVASTSYHHLIPNHGYQQQHPHPNQQPPHRTYASYPAPHPQDRNGDVPVQHLPSIQGGAPPPFAGREQWQGGHQQQHYVYGREGEHPVGPSAGSMGDGRKRGRADGGGGIPVRESDSGEEGGSGGEGSAGRGQDPEWSEGESGDLDRHQAAKRARMLETQREQQRGIDDILTSAVANSMPNAHRPPVQQPPPRQANQVAKPPPEKKFVCPHTGCNRAFARNFNLQSHIKSHMGVRDFSCPECSKKFSRKHDCSRHCIAIHGYDKETGQPPEHLLAAREEREREQAQRERQEHAMREDLRMVEGQMSLPVGREMGPP